MKKHKKQKRETFKKIQKNKFQNKAK